MGKVDTSMGGILSKALDASIQDGRPDFAAVYAESRKRSAASRHRLMLAVPIAAAFALALPLSFAALSSRSANMRAAVSELSSYSISDASWEDGIYGLVQDNPSGTETGDFIDDLWNP